MAFPAPRLAVAALALGAAGLAAVVYTPWVSRPFDLLDFSEFLHLLRREHGPLAQFATLTDYYLDQHGRLNVVSYAALALKWSLLGDAPMLWHWLRFLQMGVVVGAVYLLIRRLGASEIGAAAGAALFLCGRAAQEAWVRVTMGEPLGLLLVLAAALLITQHRRGTPWSAGAAAGVGALVAGAILSKEMLVAWVPALVLVHLGRREDGSLGSPRWSKDGVPLLIAIGVGTALSSAAVLLAASARTPDGFTASYQLAGITPGRLLSIGNRMFMPENSTGQPVWWLQRPNLFFAATCVSGLALALSRPERRTHTIWVLVLGIALPVAGAVLYLPWPYFNPFYALPFVVGPALLLATAVTAIEQHAHRVRWAAYAGAAAVAGFAAMASAYMSRVTIAHQQVNGELAHLLPRYASADSIFVAQPFAPQQAWQGWGPTLARYAIGVGAAERVPPTVDIPCGIIPELLQGRPANTLLISYPFYCGSLPVASHRIRRSFHYLDYTTLALGIDTVGADLVAQ